ncbi:hypothetical protein KIH27_19990 [Mycobacterium sp. M1]|uniref:Uncharacterized protein n=1 Tax=Mycolicibacter acidiphilus TaxID=2835306 RepID=A0ABS5RQK9_9MYCO|nr:hypothetical protein [Mycolicibacter acidiphilus]MBS9535869.1 hypothetical protein [Mycolicibacter acidiphilus]
MSNIDYVIVGTGPLLADVRNMVKNITRSADAESGWLHPADERASVYVKPDPECAGGTVVQVYYSADPPTRGQEYARSLYDELVRRTNWDLVLDSDETDGIVASRTKSRV